MPAQTFPASLPEERAQPFALTDDAAYRRWRAWKLAHRAPDAQALVVTIRDPESLSRSEHAALLERCLHTNMALFRVASEIAQPKMVLPRLAAQFGLLTLDSNPYADDEGISALQALESGKGAEYIPYTNRRLNWHTDGYYNDSGHRIRGMLLYCQRAAAEGGETLLLDHELVYIRLRDRDPELIAALMDEEALSIPPNEGDAAVTRGESSGAVFSVDSARGALHMRYTARTRSIRWKADARTVRALAALQEVVADEAPDVLRYRLQPGEGVLCNNVLHRRTAFTDAPGLTGRLVYRARYYERIAGS